MGGEPLTVEQLDALSRLPAREVLHAQLVGVIASPITGLVRGLNALIAGLAIQLQQIVEQGLLPAGEAPAEEAGRGAAAEEPAAEEPRRGAVGRARPAEEPADEAPAEEQAEETDTPSEGEDEKEG